MGCDPCYAQVTGRATVHQAGPAVLPTLRSGGLASLTFLQLDHRASRGRVVGHLTDPTLRGPSTVARARDRYLVVNADFATSAVPFTVSGIARPDGDDGDDDGGGDRDD